MKRQDTGWQKKKYSQKFFVIKDLDPEFKQECLKLNIK